MCQKVSPLYLCHCWHRPTWCFCAKRTDADIYKNRPCASQEPSHYLTNPSLFAYKEGLEFCCSEACCAAFVQESKDQYYELVREKQGLVKKGEAVGPAENSEMARLAEKMAEARQMFQGVEMRQRYCARLRKAYGEDPVGYVERA